MAAQYQYLGGYHGLHRANSASLGLGIHDPQYVMGAMSTESYYTQPSSLGMTTSPTQMSQPDLFEFQLQPPQQPNSTFTLPERRHTAYARIERPLVSPVIPFTSPSSLPQSAKFEPSETGETWILEEDSDSFESEEEEEVVINGMNGSNRSDIGPLSANNLHVPLNPHETQVRSFYSLSEDDVLVNYMPSPADTPLNNPKTASIFWYFVNVTAPTINPYERNQPDPQRMFSDDTIPKCHQHIWTYVFAVQAFQHPGLLQAILALGSLQMTELSGDGPTASMFHYGQCIRRMWKNYRSVNQRAQPATLAATLLLAWFEVWASNHDKWCTHLIGARTIIGETPLREMSMKVWLVHRQRYQQWVEVQTQNPFAAFLPQNGQPSHELAEVDLDLLKDLTGEPVYFLEGEDPSSWQSKVRDCTERDLENYEHLADLYWWFAKMDVYQAFLGGSTLFMEYRLWTQCPPRAPINRYHQAYGTFDHLVLLLGRLSNFVASDLLRKRKVRARQGSVSPRGPSSPPMFAGMFPNRGSIQHPRGLSPQREAVNSFVAAAEQFLEDADLETSTQKAMEEWSSILVAFNAFKDSLGADFQPVGSDVHPQRDSPFGPAWTYRTLPIAGIWMNFYMGLVILHRAHPSMPPFAMVAAHMCAVETQPYANEIGKIVAGVSDDWGAETMVSTLLGAAYIECCVPLFVGAVQFKDKLQRHWAIRRLHDITRLTGWKTGTQTANGCEAAWRKAAAMGHAPPYEPEPESDALRHGYTTRRIDERIQEIHEGQSKPGLERADRAHIAFGLLSVDEDFERLKVGD
ncbi:hypothetical protein N0V93_007514 [Gnomoniopsis smithogilvyi]|uniref:Transcription factor domain-containing protein n=1 Tax=Gnomoniopsis smithogilvyi TaxID=1191159 RepID=A0A9W8YSU3_9PEZI|nr:hypothetical protein N0V93_007514 [Gnomoniopsis smithogilvyi]